MIRASLVPAFLVAAVIVAACGSSGAVAPVRSVPVESVPATSAPTANAAPSPTGVATTRPDPTATPRPTVGAGESWLAFQDGEGRDYGVRLVRPDGSGLFFPTDTVEGTEQLHPDWSPDGSRLVFSVMGAAARDLWITDADGGNPEHIVVCGACSVADEPAWSPDGATIAFHRQALVDGTWVSTVELFDLATRTTRVVLQAPDDRFFGAPRWAPDSRHLVVEYIHRREGAPFDDLDGVALAIVDAAAAKPKAKVITDPSYWPANPDWSPDGSRIVFFRPEDPANFDAEADLWTIKPDGTGLTRLTHYADQDAYAVQPDWTPDGSRIAFVTGSVAGGDGVMATVAADGSDPQPATSSGYMAGVHPRFRPTP